MKVVSKLGFLTSCILFLMIQAKDLLGQESPSLFLDYTFQGGNQIELSINPTDYPFEWAEKPFSKYKKGDKMWVFVNGKSIPVHYVSSRSKGGQHPMRGGITIKLNSDVPVPTGYTILSTAEFPDQTWIYFAPTEKEKEMVLSSLKKVGKLPKWSGIKTKNNGTFLLVGYAVDQEAAFIEHKTHIFKLNRRKIWQQIAEISNDGYYAEVLGDLDGDGVPEIVGPFGYKSYRVQKIFPKLEDVVINTSGV